jgi:hydrogenase maturation protease
MPRVLVIAIGNPLPSDDGLAWRAADQLAKEVLPPEVEILKVHQLTPELAEDISHAERVIFVDAAASGEPGTLSCKRMVASSGESGSSHHLSPSALLQLAATLYGAHPEAFLVSVTGKSFVHGEWLTPEIQRSIPELVLKLHELIRAE